MCFFGEIVTMFRSKEKEKDKEEDLQQLVTVTIDNIRQAYLLQAKEYVVPSIVNALKISSGDGYAYDPETSHYSGYFLKGNHDYEAATHLYVQLEAATIFKCSYCTLTFKKDEEEEKIKWKLRVDYKHPNTKSSLSFGTRILG